MMSNNDKKMISEPHKIKTVRRVALNKSWEERAALLEKAGYNTFRLQSSTVSFDMTSQGTAARSQEQLSGVLLGDEAYAGSINFERLQVAVKRVLGHEYVCPTHNSQGNLKLLCTTMVQPGNVVLSNSLAPLELAKARGATVRCIRDANSRFSGNLNMALLAEELESDDHVAFIYIETFAEGMYPISLARLQALRRIADLTGIPLVLDCSRIVENAVYEGKTLDWKSSTLKCLVKDFATTAHVCVVDASQDARCNAGGLICTSDSKLHERYQNEVVVYEGLHTYGGMSGRSLEVFARGLMEMVEGSQAQWIEEQVELFRGLLAKAGVPFIPGCDGVYLKTDEFLPHIQTRTAQTLAAALFLQAGVRAFLQGRYKDNESLLPIQIPRLSLTNVQLEQIASAIKELHIQRNKIHGLDLRRTDPHKWHDQAVFLWSLTPILPTYHFDCEPYTIHTFENVGVTNRSQRKQAIKTAGYNTFLLMSRDVAIDLLTDSGTSAMSVEQWQAYEGGTETPATSASYQAFVDAIQDVTGYKYVIPTHQGRAAEHIMSNVMIQRGDIVPGNMYFTTTLLHQRLAGGKFVDVIVDEAHNPTSTFEWKGNIDIAKLQALVEEHGPESLPYISFEMSVNMAGGQPFSMDNVREVSFFCSKHGIPIMFDSTRAAENAYMIQKKDPRYKDTPVKQILKEIFSYGDGCTVSSKKDCLVNIGGYLAYRDNEDLYQRSMDMLRKYEGSATSGGLSAGDMAAHAQGTREMVEDDHLRARVEQTQYWGRSCSRRVSPS